MKTPVLTLSAAVIMAAAFWLPTSTRGTTVSVDLSQESITIDGFGGFGSMVPWWVTGPHYNDRFLDLVIDSLGLTILRTELYPLPDQKNAWEVQIPYLRAIKAKAQASGEPFQLYGTVWTAPSRLKTTGSVVGGWVSNYLDYADYLLDYIDIVRDSIGYDLYAVSPVNESATCFGYNSMCNWSYPNDPGWDKLCGGLYKTIGARFAQKQSRVPLSCNDHTWGPAAVGWAFDIIEELPAADSMVKITSIHYSDHTISGTREGNEIIRRVAARRPWRRQWNTEFGGQYDTWEDNPYFENGRSDGGAWTFATNLFLCLESNYNAVIYWQLCEHPHDDPKGNKYSLFYIKNNTPTPGPLFRVAQTVFRHVRPGAIKVGSVSSDTSKVWTVAYHHKEHNTVSVVMLNRSATPQTVTVAGANLPLSMNVYQTSPTQDHELVGTVAPGASITLPIKSITTLYNTPVPTGVALRPAARQPVLNSGVVQHRSYDLTGRTHTAASRKAISAGISIESDNARRTITITH